MRQGDAVTGHPQSFTAHGSCRLKVSKAISFGSQKTLSAEEELKGMAGRIKSMRAQLLQALKDVGVPGTWDHVVNQIGMFSFLGVTKVCSNLIL